MTEEAKELASEERRNFLKLATTGSFTAAVVAAAAGTLWSSEASAQTANEEREREAAAEHVMTLATEYVIGTTRSYPMMQLDVKENLQNASNGKIYVKLAPGGQLGVGSALAQKVQGGTINAGQFSLSNFAPFAPAVDLINMPYFCGANQRFVNLVTSDIWKTEVNALVEARGFKPMFYFCIDPRVMAVRKGGGGPIMTPADLQGVKFRVPGSQMLQQFYRMGGANPTPVAWGETPSAIKQGVADALDPAVGALYAFGFKDILSHVTFTQAVPDSQTYACNLEWYNTLSSDVQEAIEWASEMSFHQNLAKVPSSRTFAMAEMAKSGVEFHSLSADQLAEWQDTVGYQRSEWDSFKTELAGSMETFDKLVEAAGTQGKFYVHDA
ncbi:Solute-binding protein [Roseovarius sp. EC-HK134]|jgi:TRAP-type C4-dicarboxylate transport system substrate-binding protein|uniref:Solute-binding protein n=1 Tax=Roseovarius mucosus TaxID=215743 RepID=A0A1V0RPV9_9RHOB|nr:MULTISPECIES: TRAP transporter substrate-binding protein [Roseovarius]ARE83833.1 solute-binding protein [Roseovarius mucosus]AWZ19530.1 TRAP-type C4-dicarboxylate transport system, periplasmic component [Roseovarius sp. AK1035]EDM33705.1 TRAP dicarboxylate transporter, DctP subunit [Roseovarius sp. TM1035]VVT13556.1 Solute-binding protein [Roseovarius sp. EC-HK134]VVT14229.1 Solute-binding protein [Roseovarius sp. EC-SD190]|tara:strand:- start:774 stop:1922 length:1149 start_codon:yes stop_codon:yes gene_type:complete